MQPFFITSTGTGIGKTFVTAVLIHQLRQKGKKVSAVKPIISGFDEQDPFSWSKSDTGILLRSLGQEINVSNIQALSPWRFIAPLSPDMAAAREQRTISTAEVAAFCIKPASAAEYHFMEGAGGIMAPLNERHTMCDLIEQVGAAVILVVGSYLGTLSHTLTALQVIKQRKLKLQALIISESEVSPIALTQTRSTLQHFMDKTIPIIILPRLEGDAPWQRAVDITSIVQA